MCALSFPIFNNGAIKYITIILSIITKEYGKAFLNTLFKKGYFILFPFGSKEIKNEV